jgi:hypothetical protein
MVAPQGQYAPSGLAGGHMPWLSKTLLQVRLRWARCIWRHPCTAPSSPRSLRQNRDASRVHALCSCGVPACCASAVPPAANDIIRQKEVANTTRMVELQCRCRHGPRASPCHAISLKIVLRVPVVLLSGVCGSRQKPSALLHSRARPLQHPPAVWHLWPAVALA